MEDVEETKKYGRPDLQHVFECEPGRESECSYFHNWIGGWVKCLLPESDPMHIKLPADASPLEPQAPAPKRPEIIKDAGLGKKYWAHEADPYMDYLEAEIVLLLNPKEN